MSDLTVDVHLSEADLDRIVQRLVAAIQPLLQSQPALVGCEEMAELLSISLATLDRKRRDGQIPSIKIGSRRLYQPDSVIAAIEVTNETEGDRC